jgi:hypothetical protein
VFAWVGFGLLKTVNPDVSLSFDSMIFAATVSR